MGCSMARLLEEAFKEASKLAEVEQNSLAKWGLEELKSEGKWEQIFAESEDILGRLADKASEEHYQRKTKPLEIDRSGLQQLRYLF